MVLNVDTTLVASDVILPSNADVTFIYRGNETNYIRFLPTTGNNSSYVGMLGGEQSLYVNNPVVMTAAHELCHALGFQHEQSRPDRDDYVEIICGNIEPDSYHNFQIGCSWIFPILTSYDFNSIMHYGECAFTVCGDSDGSCPCTGDCESGDGAGYCAGGTCAHNGRTIVTLDEDFQDSIGQRQFLSPQDIKDVQNGYGVGGMNKQYAQVAGLPPLPANSGIFNPCGYPRVLMMYHPNNTIWVRGGTYSNDVSAGTYNIPGVLRAHGGSAILGGG